MIDDTLDEHRKLIAELDREQALMYKRIGKLEKLAERMATTINLLAKALRQATIGEPKKGKILALPPKEIIKV